MLNISQCPKCGVKFNLDSVQQCPICKLNFIKKVPNGKRPFTENYQPTGIIVNYKTNLKEYLRQYRLLPRRIITDDMRRHKRNLMRIYRAKQKQVFGRYLW